MKKVLLILLLGIYGNLRAQHGNDSIFVLPDTAKPVTLENFYQLVTRYHPVVKQTNLLSDVARQEIRLARGNFDPKIESEFLLKHGMLDAVVHRRDMKDYIERAISRIRDYAPPDPNVIDHLVQSGQASWSPPPAARAASA